MEKIIIDKIVILSILTLFVLSDATILSVSGAGCGDWVSVGCGPITKEGVTCKSGEMMFKDNCKTICNSVPACWKDCVQSSECAQWEQCKYSDVASSKKCMFYQCPEGEYRNNEHSCTKYQTQIEEPSKNNIIKSSEPIQSSNYIYYFGIFIFLAVIGYIIFKLIKKTHDK